MYAIEQLDTGVLIRLLRDLDVPLEQIRALVGDSGDDDLKAAYGRQLFLVRRRPKSEEA